ncbi:LysM peptidoglycan-binding domain-containing protein [Levilactobacillus brevis]|uniref:LysM peptidoglycan-binding domain-containing protein n=1 Tax=Levilactobacillus brevis TaxID=1580 RepID=UPI0021A5F8EC|nr:LysM peptidoglycan-binding domain-containing protein [Levilactobacillus brevis]MCT3598882.1 LysM peptidoglycan-binding domain-containing protein [Levilactobacillus brevis]
MDITLKENTAALVKNYVSTKKVATIPVSLMSPSQMSDKQLSTQVTKVKAKVKSDAASIAATQSTITKQQKVIDKTDDYLKKQNGYDTKKAAYDAVSKQIDDLKKQLAKAKTSKKKAIQDQIKAKQKIQKSAYADLKKLTNSASYQEQLKKQSTARSKLKSAKTKLAHEKSKKAKDKKKAAALKKEADKRKAAAKKKKQKANLAKITSAIAKHKKQPLVGQTALYRADLMSSVVYFLGEVQPTETDASDVVSIGVDNSDPRAGKSTRTSKELSGTYYVFGNTYADACKQFNAIQKLQRLDTEFIIKGFSNWNHTKISSISKTVSGIPRENALELSITFTYVKPAKVLYGKSKKSTKSKGATKGAKNRGTDKGKYSTYTVKSGDTYWALAQKKGTTVATLTKLNGDWHKTMFPGHKLKIPK